jgi:tetratricopeptide (TPR) repeat protein
MLMTTGRFPEAEQQMGAALDVDPRSSILRANLGWLYEYEGRFPKAVDQVRGVLAENPNFLAAHYKLWYIYSAMGDREHAGEEFQWVVQAIADPGHVERVRQTYQREGYDAALRDFALADDMEYYGSAVDGARSLAAIGDTDGALKLLEKAYQIHEGWMMYVQADPAFSALHSDPRFRKIVAQVRPSS